MKIEDLKNNGIPQCEGSFMPSLSIFAAALVHQAGKTLVKEMKVGDYFVNEVDFLVPNFAMISNDEDIRTSMTNSISDVSIGF